MCKLPKYTKYSLNCDTFNFHSTKCEFCVLMIGGSDMWWVSWKLSERRKTSHKTSIFKPVWCLVTYFVLISNMYCSISVICYFITYLWYLLCFHKETLHMALPLPLKTQLFIDKIIKNIMSNSFGCHNNILNVKNTLNIGIFRNPIILAIQKCVNYQNTLNIHWIVTHLISIPPNVNFVF